MLNRLVRSIVEHIRERRKEGLVGMPVCGPRPSMLAKDGSSIAVVIGILGLAVIISGAAAIIADLITAILIIAAVAVVGSLAVLAVVLRRTGLAVVRYQLAVAEPQPVTVLTALRPRSVDQSPTALRMPSVPDDIIKKTPRPTPRPEPLEPRARDCRVHQIGDGQGAPADRRLVPSPRVHLRVLLRQPPGHPDDLSQGQLGHAAGCEISDDGQ
jgi:hypothetical protein